jgi:8-oxo-dGTP diphosphatase
LIEVTAAVIHKDGKLLICQRPEGKRCELLWEFPGGKIEVGETPEECLIRECHEELGVTIKPEKLITTVEYEYPSITVNIHFFFCELVDAEPECIEHNDIQWLSLDEILKLPLCPADSKMLGLAMDIIIESYH